MQTRVFYNDLKREYMKEDPTKKYKVEVVGVGEKANLKWDGLKE